MQIIYNSNFTDHKLPADIVADSRILMCGYEVNSFAVFGIDGQVTIEASDNDFAATTYSTTATADSIVSITPITAAKWRITADPGVTIGSLYIGQLINIKEPSFPYSFETSVSSSDRKTVGGIGYSKINYTKKSGVFNWRGIQTSEQQSWRDWYDNTQGFRKGYVIKEPLTNDIVLVRSPSGFPLIGQQRNNLTASLLLEAVL